MHRFDRLRCAAPNVYHAHGQPFGGRVAIAWWPQNRLSLSLRTVHEQTQRLQVVGTRVLVGGGGRFGASTHAELEFDVSGAAVVVGHVGSTRR